MSIEVCGVNKTFNRFKVLNGIDLKVETGELVALLGPSGSGKTTLLRVIAGMEAADPGSGPILFDGRDVSAQGVGKRRIGFVFQHYQRGQKIDLGLIVADHRGCVAKLGLLGGVHRLQHIDCQPGAGL
jgi:ABC-type sulfate/molybdate transport systems ATPase subunit